jgi:hypothetical protein
MTTKKDQHVVPSSDGKWAVRSTGAERASKKFESKLLAVKYARTIARSASTGVYVHSADGRVLSKDSYAPGATLAGKSTIVGGAAKSSNPIKGKK